MSMTIAEMAKQLNVSKSTVSRALSGKGRISQETRERVQAFAREQGMHFNDRKTQTKNIGVLIPADAYSRNALFFQESLIGISEATSALDFHVLVASGAVHDITDVKNLVENNKVDAFILMRNVTGDKVIEYLMVQDFPTGLLGVCENDEIIQIDINNYDASEDLTTMLINKGYSKFAFIGGNIDYRVNMDRYEGFANAITKYGLSIGQQSVYHNVIENSGLDNMIGEIIASGVECIICADDVICVKILSRLQSRGYQVPNDISIASLYNSQILDYFSPAITAVNVSANRVGNLLAQQVINRNLGKSYKAKTIVDYEILFRRSTDKPNN